MEQRDLVLDDLLRTYADSASNAFARLYSGDHHVAVAWAFASMHERLNGLLRFLNSKLYNRHYNAAESRGLLDLIAEIRDVTRTLARIGINMRLREDYEHVLEECAAFLVPSGGSAIPDDFKEIAVERFAPVFLTDVALPKGVGDQRERPKLILVGEGSFAHVHKFVDPAYGITVAQKTAKKDLRPRDLARFRAEFEIMKGLSFPNVVEVYAYDETANSYTMEFCDITLAEHIQRNNASLSWTARKRIALQFLYGVYYLHRKNVLHRDISRKNVLIRRYDEGAVQVKLSDFGLHKGPESDCTRADTSMKGTIVDPALESFKDFEVVNDIYAVGHVLLFIFTGRTALGRTSDDIQRVIQRCTDNDPAQRFQTVREVIAAVEVLTDPASAGSDTAGAPA